MVARTDPSSPDAAGAATRRLNIGGMPPAPTLLLLTALVAASAVGAASIYTIGGLRAALLDLGFSNRLVSFASVLLVLASGMIALPWLQTLWRWQEVRRAVARDDVVRARLARSDAVNRGWIAQGYIFAQFIAVLLCQFLLANNQAVAKTFFFVPLMVETFPLVLKAFWVNVE